MVFEKVLADMRRERTATPIPLRAAKPAAHKFYLPAGAEDTSSEDEWHDMAATAEKLVAACTDEE